MIARFGASRAAFPRTPRAQQAALVGIGAGLAVVLAYVLVRRSPAAALALLAVPPAAWLLLTRRVNGLLFGVVLMLTVPYWVTLGAAQASVLRLASLAALITFLLGRRPRPAFTDYALLLWVAIVFMGWLLQYQQPHAGRVVTVELTPIVFYLGTRAIGREHFEKLASVVLFAGTAGAITVLFEYVHGSPVFSDPTTYLWNPTTNTIFRPGGVFGSPPGASTVLAIVIIFGLASLAGLRGKAKRIAIVCLVICTVALVSTFTRAPLIGAGLGIVVFLWLTRSPLLRPTRLLWGGGVFAVVLLLALPALEKNTLFDRGVLRTGLQSTLTQRESFWQLALPIAVASPHNFVLGVGTGSLETPLISNGALVPFDMATTPQVFENSLHNQYVTTLVEQGVIGLGALILFLASAAIQAGRAARATRDPVFAAAAASVVALAVVMTADTALLHGPSFAIAMVAAAIGAGATAEGRGMKNGG